MPADHETDDRPRHERAAALLDDALYALAEAIDRETGDKHPRTALAVAALLAEHPQLLHPPAPPREHSAAESPEEPREWLVDLLADLDAPAPRLRAGRGR